MGTSFLPPDAVLACFTDISQVPLAALQSPSKSRIISHHRQRAMWILRQMTSITMGEIGAMLGGRTAPTIKEGVDRIEAMIGSDRQERRELEAIVSFIQMLVKAEDKAPAAPKDPKVAAALGILADRALSDADARLAALSILLASAEVARHG